MAMNLHGRHFLTLLDFSSAEIRYLLDLSEKLKADKRAGIRAKNLEGMSIALIFEKPSTRTRCAFVTACVDEGAHPEYLEGKDLRLGVKESTADVARVLGRMFDGIEFRGFAHETAEDLAKWAGVPVWNGLTDRYHPTQVLADFLTVRENFGANLRGFPFTYVGDGRNNVANSLMIGAAKTGMDFRIGAPASLHPEEALVDRCRKIAADTGGKITITDSVQSAVKGSLAIYTDVWASMGEEDKIPERIAALKAYRVTAEMMAMTGEAETIFLHCLPCFHDTSTEVGRKFPDICEATDEVFEGLQSRVFDQAENRLHTIKAVMVATLGR
ncbi:MAG: ornithine carbamoyltransferase, catabolic [Gemmatimonadota bacterium]|nr:MAG: ornithine carbamoyltransferase, catabolic [Gemmatimonadota bacterium]